CRKAGRDIFSARRGAYVQRVGNSAIDKILTRLNRTDRIEASLHRSIWSEENAHPIIEQADIRFGWRCTGTQHRIRKRLKISINDRLMIADIPGRADFYRDRFVQDRLAKLTI